MREQQAFDAQAPSVTPPSWPSPRALSKLHLPALDRVRGLAIALVMVHNLSSTNTRVTVAQKLWCGFVETGWIGVTLFFALSGFLITGILLDDRGRPRALRAFYIRRFLRIFPLYYAFLILYFVALAPFFPELRAPFSRGIWYWLYLSNWTDITPQQNLPGIGHFWSLAVEEQFYLVWPWLVVGLSSRGLARACLAVMVGAMAARIVLVGAHLPTEYAYHWTLTRADALVAGALLAVAIRSPRGRAALTLAMRPIGALLLAAVGALFAVTHGLNRLNPLMQTVGYSIIAGLSGLLVVAAATPPAPSARTGPGARFMAFLGKHSYALYVIHMPLKLVTEHFWGGRLAGARAVTPIGTDVLQVLALAAGSIALARFTWVALERPFLSLKDRWAPRGA
jgi:peptidoglycan/LPS O-acetylase OafA/YrhL